MQSVEYLMKQMTGNALASSVIRAVVCVAFWSDFSKCGDDASID